MSGATDLQALYDKIKAVIGEINATAAFRIHPIWTQRLLGERLLLSKLWESLTNLELGNVSHLERLQVLIKRLLNPMPTISDIMYVSLVSASGAIMNILQGGRPRGF
jgi:hypothetical protein